MQQFNKWIDYKNRFEQSFLKNNINCIYNKNEGYN